MKKLILAAIFLFCFLVIGFAQEEYPGRIISLSPSVTEILYKLELGDKVVGVTDYCNFPDEVKDKSRIGGYLNINYEAIILLRPDLAIVPIEYGEEIKDVFDKAEIENMTVNTATVEGILSSIEKIGRKCGVKERAEEVITRINDDIDELKEKVEEKSSGRVMIVVGRNKGTFENLYIASKKTFYNELLEILDCENAYTKTDINYPAISLEGVIRLNPDIIIEMLPGCADEKKSEIIEEWNFLKDVNAVKNEKVYVFNEDYVCIPGPRFTLILQKIAEIL